jgi:hypothetical protein
MSDAKVYSIDAIKLFRERLATFGEEAKNALVTVEMETRRAVDLILRQQPIHWQAQLKKRNEQLAQAKAELFRRRLAETRPDSLNDSEQKEAVRRAQHRVQEAERKLETIKKWAVPLQQAVDQYHGQSRGLEDLVGPRLEQALAQLERMIAALEAYTGRTAPTESGASTESP